MKKPPVHWLEALSSFSWLAAWGYAVLLALVVLSQCVGDPAYSQAAASAPAASAAASAPAFDTAPPGDVKRVFETEHWSLLDGTYCNAWYFRHVDRYQPWWVGRVAFDAKVLGTQAATDIILAARRGDWAALAAKRTHTLGAPELAAAWLPCMRTLPAAPPGPWIATPSAALALDAPMYPVPAGSVFRSATPLQGIRAARGLTCSCETVAIPPATTGGSTYCAVRSMLPKYPRAVTRCVEVK